MSRIRTKRTDVMTLANDIYQASQQPSGKKKFGAVTGTQFHTSSDMIQDGSRLTKYPEQVSKLLESIIVEKKGDKPQE